MANVPPLAAAPMRPPTAPEARPLAQGCPLGPRGALAAWMPKRGYDATHRCPPSVADSIAVDHLGVHRRSVHLWLRSMPQQGVTGFTGPRGIRGSGRVLVTAAPAAAAAANAIDAAGATATISDARLSSVGERGDADVGAGGARRVGGVAPPLRRLHRVHSATRLVKGGSPYSGVHGLACLSMADERSLPFSTLRRARACGLGASPVAWNMKASPFPTAGSARSKTSLSGST
jgi:hypothetical protein